MIQFKRRRNAVVLIATLFVALFAAGCGGGASSGKSSDHTIRVVTAVDNAWYYVAAQQKELLQTFEGSGINVELVAGTTPTIGQILASGQADVALAGGTTLAALRAQGIEQTIVGNDISRFAMYVVVNDNVDAEKVEDLKGANFGITGKGAPSDHAVFKIAEKYGWSTTDYQTTSFGDVGSLVAGFRSGAIDAMVWLGDVAAQLEEEGVGRILGDAADYVGPTVFNAFGVMDGFAEDNAEDLRIFFEHYYAKVQELQEDPATFVNALVEGGKFSEPVAKSLAESQLSYLSADGKLTDEEIEGLSEHAAFSMGDRDSEEPVDVEYVYWQDFLK